ncbi:hypothetical protein H696_05036 [Fonticula alba]|uniref:Uncharacterized protein n=1 Tax=Fonticula alba TaxID=691883 RepID=A0A058Z3N3_FONAL|nr:hypothetical protein H696_05036 [Fonticula alba]KCV68751.1 hypothetical protein H696_05036 [Fonticula alba]|eukprot:XP_009497183.1 hypothetical protein H696_05036 [Fonticula alba]
MSSIDNILETFSLSPTDTVVDSAIKKGITVFGSTIVIANMYKFILHRDVPTNYFPRHYSLRFGGGMGLAVAIYTLSCGLAKSLCSEDNKPITPTGHAVAAGAGLATAALLYPYPNGVRRLSVAPLVIVGGIAAGYATFVKNLGGMDNMLPKFFSENAIFRQKAREFSSAVRSEDQE